MLTLTKTFRAASLREGHAVYRAVEEALYGAGLAARGIEATGLTAAVLSRLRAKGYQAYADNDGVRLRCPNGATVAFERDTGAPRCADNLALVALAAIVREAKADSSPLPLPLRMGVREILLDEPMDPDLA